MKFFILPILMLSSVAVASQWKDIDKIIGLGISHRLLPSAVLMVGDNQKFVMQDAYGRVDTDATTEDTIYDLASLTKVVGTTSSLMVLLEKGDIQLTDKLSKYFPEFTGPDKDTVTIDDVMRHKAGLPGDIGFRPEDSYADFLKRVITVNLSYHPRTDVIYSDLGFILLAEIVKKVSGKTLEQFATENVFRPLKMNTTFYNVPQNLKETCAPTNNEECRVHDPIAARFLPEQLGHAGLFSTAVDLSRLAQMYLNLGKLDGVQVFKEETVKQMITLPTGEIRGLGWDLLSGYADAPRGEIYPKGISFGHTGYTGTSIWIDPQSKSFMVFLTNRVYSGDTSSRSSKFSGLRYDLATAVAHKFYGKK
jgi:CubicO group peptidase (beta-lactamase class C family)